MKCHLRGNTVRISKVDDVKVTRNGEEGTMKVAYFTVADREKMARKDADGNRIYKTEGFWFCKAVGYYADFLVKYFSEKDDEGKLKSRRIYMDLHPEQYKGHKTVDVQMKVPVEKLFSAVSVDLPESLVGKTINLVKQENVEYDTVVYVVDDIDFDDLKRDSVEVKLDDDGENKDITLNL
jgi:hypothetical protein